MPEPGPLRVAIGQVANLISLGIWSVLSHDSGFQVVATHQGYSGLIATLVSKAAPHVILLDEALAVPAVIAGLRDQSPSVRIVAITHGSTALSSVLRARLAERHGISCISTNASSTELRAAIRLAAEGQALLTSHSIPRSVGVAGYSALTPREGEVLSCLLRGCRPAQVAVQLHIAPSTARTHVRHIYRKLGVRSREQLLRLELPTVHLGPH